MTAQFQNLKRYIKSIYRILIILISALIILFLFPKKGSFKYEFHKGNPWKHTTLIAPFDFPIYKTDKAIDKEKELILNNYSPFFIFNESIVKNNINKFKEHFNSEWNNFLKYQTNLDTVLFNTKKHLTYNKCSNLIKEIYGIGIINNLNNKDYKNVISVKIVKNNIAGHTLLSNIYTPKKAYEYFTKAIKEKISHKSTKNFIKKLNINSFLVPNLSYDKEKSKQLKEDMIANISLTNGMIQSGTRIIMQGDIVDENTFIILSSLKVEYEKHLGTQSHRYLLMIGRFFIILACLAFLALFLWNFRRRTFYTNKKILFIYLIITILTVVTLLVSKMPFLNIYIVPIILVPIIIASFTDPKTAMSSLLTICLLTGYIVPNSYEFVFLHFIAGSVALFSLHKLHRRGQLILTTIFVFLSYSLTYIAFALTQENDILNIYWYMLAWFAGNCFLLTLSYPLIFIFEKMFGFISDTTLIELSNPNHPLLRELTRKAPGTFQHSLQVANLAEEAIYQIGGNPLLVRAGALYHDIGKMNNPVYFIENQPPDIQNPHNSLEFNESANIITKHVKDGIKLAKKHNLPDQIIQFISTHHGEGKALYFYNSYKNKFPDKDINEDEFTYPGPNPISKETAVLMMADAIEASCRSLKDKTVESITKLINQIIDKQIEDGKFNSADITFKDIETIKKAFINMEINIHHSRIAYPKEKKKDE